MRRQFTLIHIEIVLNVHTFILQCIFSGWGNEMSPEKNLHHFCIWHPPSFDFYIVILSPGINEFFSTRPIEKNPIQLTSSQTICYLCHLVRTIYLAKVTLEHF